MRRPDYYFLVLLLLTSIADPLYAREKNVIGWIEKVKVYPAGLDFKAKMDSGAYNSSINALNIIEFERDGEAWVRFDIVNKNHISSTLELPLVKEVTIKRHFGKKQRRYAVMLGVCLGKVYKETQVSLVNREGFLYKMLIGRNFLKEDFVIDPAEQFTSKPRCRVPDNE